MKKLAISVLSLLLAACSPREVKPHMFRAPEGEPFTVSKASMTEDKKTFEIGVVPPDGMTKQDAPALSDVAFRGLAGPAAENAKLVSATVEVGSLYRGHYEKDKTGAWKRADGERAPALDQLGRAAPDGVKLVMTSRAAHDGELFVVFFCESCSGGDAPLAAAGALYDLAVGELRKATDAAKAKKLHATVYAGPRKTAWDFPPLVYLSVEKGADGTWKKPELTRREFVDAIARKLHPQ